jgi:tetratricopeptide (TPR) repeat protein
MNAVLEAQKAEAFLKTNNYASAELHAKRAAQADPDEPSYTALLAWIHAQQRPVPPVEEGKTSSLYDDLIMELDAVLKKEPDYERALYYRAVLLKRSGRIQRAMKDFRRVAELAPNNIDAAREVRLYDMRNDAGGGNKGGPPNGAGIFNKFFKR